MTRKNVIYLVEQSQLLDVPGTYEISKISLAQARHIVYSASDVRSAILDERATRVMSSLLNLRVDVSRETTRQKTETAVSYLSLYRQSNSTSREVCENDTSSTSVRDDEWILVKFSAKSRESSARKIVDWIVESLVEEVPFAVKVTIGFLIVSALATAVAAYKERSLE